jgi:hypothetical protein
MNIQTIVINQDDIDRIEIVKKRNTDLPELTFIKMTHEHVKHLAADCFADLDKVMKKDGHLLRLGNQLTIEHRDFKFTSSVQSYNNIMYRLVCETDANLILMIQ